METKQLGITAALVGLVGLAIRNVVAFVPAYLAGRLSAGPAPGWVPTLGTVGETVTIYNYVSGTLGPVLVLGLGLAFGYVLETRHGVSSEFRHFARTVLLGSALGVVLALAVLGSAGALVSSSPIDAGSFLFYLLVLSQSVAEVALPLTIATLAGATLAHVGADDDRPPRPTDADSPPPTSANSESRADEPERHTHATR
ncbi:hypothetical protein [Haloarchaeobius sp. HRN-SO-5]|uniref:hypothetical protein n=1 Tax=Haloarchaeobius sp. HRN-SO-5 TaxID=3446118 RepID=UPI003EC07A4E